MFSFLKRLLGYMRDFPSKIKISLNPKIKIAETASISAYRRISIKDGSRLEIGDQTLMQGNIVTERSDAYVTIGSRTFIGGSNIVSANRINIGDDVLISWGCTIIDHDSHPTSWSKRSNDVIDWAKGEKNWQHVNRGVIHIHDKVWIGANVIILKNVSIGEGAIVGAGSVITKDVPAWTIVAGNPAKEVRVISEDNR